MQRRHFIQQAGALTGLSFWSCGQASSDASLAQRKLIVVMLRGAVDGLSVVVPYAEPAYADSRSSTALSRLWPWAAAGPPAPGLRLV